jgi:hypothetical protein
MSAESPIADAPSSTEAVDTMSVTERVKQARDALDATAAIVANKAHDATSLVKCKAHEATTIVHDKLGLLKDPTEVDSEDGGWHKVHYRGSRASSGNKRSRAEKDKDDEEAVSQDDDGKPTVLVRPVGDGKRRAVASVRRRRRSLLPVLVSLLLLLGGLSVGSYLLREAVKEATPPAFDIYSVEATSAWAKYHAGVYKVGGTLASRSFPPFTPPPPHLSASL